jgi:hypothetical protein
MSQPVQPLQDHFDTSASSVGTYVAYGNLSEAQNDYKKVLSLLEKEPHNQANLRSALKDLNRVVEGTEQFLHAAQTSGGNGPGTLVNDPLDYYMHAKGLRQVVRNELARITPAVPYKASDYKSSGPESLMS